ncbi:30S ribosomal protein S19 [Candidatus Parcubacteria bacterium]|nr:MAG: 30S ribosomal protein S19 [Candidatus Parcubacteria bacterium]
MARSSKKGPFVDPKLLKKISKIKPEGGAVIKTWSRASEIAPEMVGYTFGVHNGKIFVEVKVTEEMVGHRLGEFSHTRKFVKHGGKIQRELEQKTTEGAATQAAPAAKAEKK